MHDHFVGRVSYPIVGAQAANARSRGMPLAAEFMRWVITGKRMLTYSPSIVAASAKVLEESATMIAEKGAAMIRGAAWQRMAA